MQLSFPGNSTSQFPVNVVGLVWSQTGVFTPQLGLGGGMHDRSGNGKGRARPGFVTADIGIGGRWRSKRSSSEVLVAAPVGCSSTIWPTHCEVGPQPGSPPRVGTDGWHEGLRPQQEPVPTTLLGAMVVKYAVPRHGVVPERCAATNR